MAYALAMVMASDMVQVAHLRLETLPDNYKYVFFCGNYVNHPVMRKLVTQEWLKRDLQMKTFMGGEVITRFVYFRESGDCYQQTSPRHK